MINLIYRTTKIVYMKLCLLLLHKKWDNLSLGLSLNSYLNDLYDYIFDIYSKEGLIKTFRARNRLIQMIKDLDFRRLLEKISNEVVQKGKKAVAPSKEVVVIAKDSLPDDMKNLGFLTKILTNIALSWDRLENLKTFLKSSINLLYIIFITLFIYSILIILFRRLIITSMASITSIPVIEKTGLDQAWTKLGLIKDWLKDVWSRIFNYLFPFINESKESEIRKLTWQRDVFMRRAEELETKNPNYRNAHNNWINAISKFCYDYQWWLIGGATVLTLGTFIYWYPDVLPSFSKNMLWRRWCKKI